MKIYLADDGVMPAVRDTLRGTTPSDTRNARVEIEREGKPQTANLMFTVKKIEKVNLPPVDNDLITKVTKGKITDVAEFRKKLREDIESYWNDFSDRTMTDAIVHEIVQQHDFTVPESFVKSITDSYIEDSKNQAPNKTLPAGFDEVKFRQEYRASAIFQAKWFLIRDKIVAAENISITEQELEERAIADAPKMGIDKERLLQFYKTSSSVSDRIVTDKLMTLLKGSAKITEKTDTAQGAAK
jgi:FKBP-type peptidyl-prolyl cis-trans isomerase (trigger factor)